MPEPKRGQGQHHTGESVPPAISNYNTEEHPGKTYRITAFVTIIWSKFSIVYNLRASYNSSCFQV